MSCGTFDNLISCPPLNSEGVRFVSNFCPSSAATKSRAVQKWLVVGQISNKCSGKCRSRREQICSCASIFVVISIFEVIYSKYSNCCGKGLQTKVCSDGPAHNENVQLEEICTQFFRKYGKCTQIFES